MILKNSTGTAPPNSAIWVEFNDLQSTILYVQFPLFDANLVQI